MCEKRGRPKGYMPWPFHLAAFLLLSGMMPLSASASPLETPWMSYSLSGLAVGTGIALPYLFVSSGGPACGDCDPSEVPAFDRWIAGVYREEADALSHTTLAFSFAAPLGGWSHEFAREGTHTTPLVVSQSMSATFLVTQVMKVSFQRARPFTYGVETPSNSTRDARLSFPSGHTSMAFAALMSTAAINTQGARTSKKVAWYGFATGLGSLTGALRVVAGKHYWTDVIAGAAIGTGLGLLFPALHSRTKSSSGRPEPVALPLLVVGGTL